MANETEVIKKNKSVEITEAEIKEQIEIWQRFVVQFPEKLKLQPDTEKVMLLAKGVLSNKKRKGFGYCPCRITSGVRSEDLKLLCPCNFRIQETWKEKGECWCSLFVKG
jgi:ferredoxin-thioredoxin reductase catalytic chain